MLGQAFWVCRGGPAVRQGRLRVGEGRRRREEGVEELGVGQDEGPQESL